MSKTDAASRTATTPKLTRDSIVDAYIRIADREGRTVVSLRQLGEELGTDPTAIYRHFRDKADLLAAVADRLLAKVADSYAPTGDWKQDIRNMAIHARAVYLAHPPLARLLALSPSQLPNNTRLIEKGLSAFRSGGLSGADAASAMELLENYVAGTSSLTAEIGSQDDDTWRRSLASLPPDQFPNTTAVSEHLYQSDEKNFEFGLDLILDALGARASGRAARL